MTTAGDAANDLRRNPTSWQLLGRMKQGDGWIVLTNETDNDHLPCGKPEFSYCKSC